MKLDRRTFLQLGTAGLLAPSAGLALPRQSDERCFLFVYCSGGWDTTRVFTPLFDNPDASMESEATTSSASGIDFVDHPERPSVRWFFEQWGDQAAVLNGFEVQSLTHERCRQLVLTGRSDSGADDWPTILGAHSNRSLLLPHVILDGYAFTDRYSSKVVRVGDRGQLAKLLDGSALTQADGAIILPTTHAEALEEAALLARLKSLEAAAASGQEDAFVTAYRRAAKQHARLSELDLDFEVPLEGCERDVALDGAKAFDLFELGTTRCAMIRYNGWCNEGWDTHQNLELQSVNFQDLFSYLDLLMLDLQERDGLQDRVTIVVFSEMGRAPQLNSWGGKDHWTTTSAMLIGAGVQGGQVVGALDQSGLGQPVNLQTGQLQSGGTALLPAHIGATLLALGDVDPAEFTGSAAPIQALIR
jgi:hypothetical protein